MTALAAARDQLDRFHRMLRGRDEEALASWVADTEGGLLASFGKGVRADLAAWVRAPIPRRSTLISRNVCD